METSTSPTSEPASTLSSKDNSILGQVRLWQEEPVWYARNPSNPGLGMDSSVQELVLTEWRNGPSRQPQKRAIVTDERWK
jgi:hypothetical protein